MASGIVRGAVSTVLDDEKPTKSDKMRQFGKIFLDKIVEGEQQMELFDKFCENINSDMEKIFLSLSPRLRSPSSKRTKLWSVFHEQREKTLPRLWQDLFTSLHLEGDQLFPQSVNQELFQQMLTSYFAKKAVPNQLETNNLH